MALAGPLPLSLPDFGRPLHETFMSTTPQGNKRWSLASDSSDTTLNAPYTLSSRPDTPASSSTHNAKTSLLGPAMTTAAGSSHAIASPAHRQPTPLGASATFQTPPFSRHSPSSYPMGASFGFPVSTMGIHHGLPSLVPFSFPSFAQPSLQLHNPSSAPSAPHRPSPPLHQQQHPDPTCIPPSEFPVALAQANNRPRAASDRIAPPQFTPFSVNVAAPRSQSFSNAAPSTVKSALSASLPSRNRSQDHANDDDLPLAHHRPRNDSQVSAVSSIGVHSDARSAISSNASSRSITPTPDSADQPRSSLATARNVPAAHRQTPSLSHSRSAPSLHRPSPLSQERISVDLSSDDMHNAAIGQADKRHGFGRIKKSLMMNANDSASSTSSLQRGHEKGSLSVTSNTSFSSSTTTSTSPPRTPPDPAFISPHIYMHQDAADSTATLPSETSNRQKPKKKLGSLFNSKMNSSTDNISISSTVSSASMMIRKIGSFGNRLSKRGSLGSIGSMFHKDRGDASSDMGLLPSSSKSKKKDRKKANLASANVSHVYAEQDSPPRSGLTPAKALVQQQQQLYAQQEAAERSKREAEEQAAKQAATNGDKRLKAIEKEKEKLKGRRVKKWGIGSFGGGSSISYGSAANGRFESGSQEDLNEFGQVSDEIEVSHHEHASLAGPSTTPRVPVPSFLDDQQVLGSSTFADATTSLFDARWEATAEAPVSKFDADSFSSARKEEPLPMPEHDSGLFTPKPLPQPNYKPRGILKSTWSDLERLGLDAEGAASKSLGAVPQAAHFAPPLERARANSANSANSRQGFFRPDQMVDSPAESPISEVISPRPGPYRNPGLNISAPVLNPQPAAPVIAHRSVTAPPGKRLAFASELSVHTTWPAAVYDRRSEPATCNKLTPQLAQRIKEELNAYKLNEMDVHHTSRIYTHFFA